MTRVSSFGHHQQMLHGLMDSQSRLSNAQIQINTGKKTTEFRGVSREAQTLLGAKSLKTRTEGYLANAAEVKRKLDSNNIQLEAIRRAADDLKQSLTETLGQDDAVAFHETLEQAASVILNALNTNIGGTYLFAGSRSETRPVTAGTLADLVAAPTVAGLFQNDEAHLSSRVGDGVEITHGIVASEVAEDLLASIKALGDFDAGPLGPLDGKLTSAQRAFLEGEMANLIAGIDKVQARIADNGLRQNRIEAVEGDLSSSRDFLEVFIGDIEDVNMAEAVTRMNADQLALQASYQIMSQLSRLSLLNFL